MEKDAQLGIIILAAGKASRMGEPKALLTYQGHSFLLNTYNIAQSVHPKGIVTVLGHYFDQMSAHCNTHKIPFVLNEAYEIGMSSSIQCGLTYLLSHFPQINMVLILLADQPKINTEHISALLHKIRSSKYLMVCTAYSATYGVPPVFASPKIALFANLSKFLASIGASVATTILHEPSLFAKASCR